MLTDFAAVGQQEAWNTARLAAYLANVGSPFSTGAEICRCASLTPAILGETFPAYRTPVLDPAPWYDADVTESGEYLGFLPLSITGIDDNPRSRAVTNAVGGGGVFGPTRALPRTMTVTGLIIGTSCCGAEYGLNYLSEVLSGCVDSLCDGGCFEMYNCCPEGVTLTPAQFNAAHRRTFRRTALVSGPTVIKRDGTGQCASGGCGAGGDIITVEFVLVAATPWAWTDVTDLLSVPFPDTGSSPCIDWCLRDPVTNTGDCDASECLFGDCSMTDTCPDPNNPVPSPPQPTIPPASFCVSLGSERDCYDIDLSTRPQWGTDVPVITLYAGSSELRNIRVLLFEKPVGTTLTCDQIADNNRCTPHSEFVVTYLQAGGTIVIDGQTGRSVTDCHGVCRTSVTVYGDQEGGPVRINEMTCAMFCLCIESDPAYPPAADATFTFGVSGRGY